MCLSSGGLVGGFIKILLLVMRDASISIAVSSKVVKNLELLSRSEIPKFRKFRISLFRNLTEVLGKGYFYYFEFPLKAMEPYFHTRLVYVRSNHRINNPVLSITSRYHIYELWPSHLWITRRYLIYELLPSHFLDLAPKFY